MIDIGCNLTHPALNSQLPEVLKRAAQAGVDTMIVTAADVADSQAALELAHRYDGCLYATAGVHPHHASQWDNTSYAALKALASDAKVVAIGEAGLDYYRNLSTPAEQHLAFEKQIDLAVESGLPLFMHQRDAHHDFIARLKPHRPHLSQAVVHCFTGNRAMLDDYLALDLYIGVTGWICDERRATDLRAAVAAIPAERLLLETDAPYLIPRTLGKAFRNRANEPMHLPHIAHAVAQRRGVEASELIAQTVSNSRAFYRRLNQEAQ